MREGKGSERQREQGSFPPQPLLRGCPTASSAEAQRCSRIDPVKPHLHPLQSTCWLSERQLTSQSESQLLHLQSRDNCMHLKSDGANER